MRTLLFSLLLSFLSVSSAHVQEAAPPVDAGAAIALSVTGSALTLALDAALVVASLDAAAHGHLVTAPWAVTEVVNGAAHLGLSLAQITLAARDAEPLDAGGIAFGAVIAFVGLLFSGHGLTSLALGPLATPGPSIEVRS
jgi:hypothetical protein